MKEIAHSYVAERVIGRKHPDLCVGSLLPDLLPYTVAVEIFDYVELHDRGGEKLLRYLQAEAPENQLLAFGMLAHGRVYGADRYNDVEYKGGPGYAFQKTDEKLIEEVWICSGINREAAPVRAHNFIELGVDCLLLQKDPNLVKRISQALTNVNLEQISQYLADCFQKDKNKVLAGLNQLFSCFRLEDLNSAEGLARIWARQAAGLPEQDKVDVKKATKVIEKAADLIKNDYEDFLDFTILRVRENLKPFLFSVE